MSLAKLYQASLQRWLTRDPLQEEGSLNLYTCVLNNAVNRVDALGLLIDDPPEDIGFTYNDILTAFVMAQKAGIKGPGGDDMLQILLKMLQSPIAVSWTKINITNTPETRHEKKSRAYPSDARIYFPKCVPWSGQREICGERGTKFYFHAAILHEMIHAYQAMTGSSGDSTDEEEQEPRRIGDALNAWLEGRP